MAFYIHSGTAGKCPDCNEPTFVRRASLLGEVNSEWTIQHDLMRSICRSIVKSYKPPKLTKRDYERSAQTRKPVSTNKRLVCSVCSSSVAKGLHWIEPIPSALVGPFCKACLLHTYRNNYGDSRGVGVDYPIYIVPGNKKVLRMARAAMLLGKPVHTLVDLPTDEETVLF